LGTGLNGYPAIKKDKHGGMTADDFHSMLLMELAFLH